MLRKAHQLGYVFGFENDLIMNRGLDPKPSHAVPDDPFDSASDLNDELMVS